MHLAFSKKIPGTTVYRKGTDLDLAKAKAIRNLEPPKMVNQLKSFLRKVSYIRRFISALIELLKLVHKLLKKDVSLKWTEKQHIAFQ